eukprot:5689801-Pleurochrysis_carterae.AAC.1
MDAFMKAAALTQQPTVRRGKIQHEDRSDTKFQHAELLCATLPLLLRPLISACATCPDVYFGNSDRCVKTRDETAHANRSTGGDRAHRIASQTNDGCIEILDVLIARHIVPSRPATDPTHAKGQTATAAQDGESLDNGSAALSSQCGANLADSASSFRDTPKVENARAGEHVSSLQWPMSNAVLPAMDVDEVVSMLYRMFQWRMAREGGL